jgi:hypothetical protein
MPPRPSQPALRIDLSAVIVSVVDDQPLVLVTGPEARPALPSADFDAADDDTLELGMRRVVRTQTGVEVAYLEQLYTFGDARRSERERLLTVAYLALTRQPRATGPCGAAGGDWVRAYDLFPWEDHRDGAAAAEDAIERRLRRWAGRDDARRERAGTAFGLDGSPWDPARVLERYELLYEVGLGEEVAADRGLARATKAGRPLRGDDRRIVATALGRLRGKLTYRPVVFELLPATFTLSALQACVEALVGRRLHAPNFRRLVETTGLVEGTGTRVAGATGRPAELHRFRREVLRERPAPGLRLLRSERGLTRPPNR